MFMNMWRNRFGWLNSDFDFIYYYYNIFFLFPQGNIMQLDQFSSGNNAEGVLLNSGPWDHSC